MSSGKFCEWEMTGLDMYRVGKSPDGKCPITVSDDTKNGSLQM